MRRTWLCALLAFVLSGCERDAAAPPATAGAAPAMSPAARAAGDGAWTTADRQHTRNAYQRFLDDYPGHPQAATARRKLGNLDWAAIERYPTEAAWMRFAEQHPDHPRAAAARVRAGDIAFRKAKTSDTVAALNEFLGRYPDHYKAGRARELLAGEKVSLSSAVSRGWVKASVSGRGLAGVKVQLRRRQPKRMRVVIPAGTFYVCHGAAQNMVGRTDHEVQITDDNLHEVEVDAACAQFHAPEPGGGDTFTIRSDAPDGLRQLMRTIQKRQPPEVVAQVAVWAVTDNPSRAELRETYRTSYGGAAAGPDDLQAAAELLRAAGINPRSKRLFR